MKRVLVACEESQEVCKAFRELGFEAYSCDILECSGGHPEWHIQDDVLRHLGENWDLIIAHPPCTYLCSAGQPWTNIEKYGEKAIQRIAKRQEAFEFFMQFINANCPHIAVENPAGVVSTYYRKPDQYIEPYQFGHECTKRTGLWLKNLPKLVPTNIVEPKMSWAWDNLRDENGKILAWNSQEIKKLRSKTFPGIAKAMAEQWSDYILKEDM